MTLKKIARVKSVKSLSVNLDEIVKNWTAVCRFVCDNALPFELDGQVGLSM